MEHKSQAINLEVKALAEDGSFSGYAAVFDVEDAYKDIIRAGAFTASLKSNPDVKLLWQHNVADPIGTITSMQEDSKGLLFEAQLLLDIQRGKEAYSMLKNKVISGISIGYSAVKWKSREQSEDDKWYHSNRELLEVELGEISLVTFPANPKATVVSVKDRLQEGDITTRELEQLLTQDAGLSRSQARALMSSGIKGLNVTQDAGALSEALTKATNVLTNNHNGE